MTMKITDSQYDTAMKALDSADTVKDLLEQLETFLSGVSDTVPVAEVSAKATA